MNKLAAILKTTWFIACGIVILISTLIAFAYSKIFKRKKTSNNIEV